MRDFSIAVYRALLDGLEEADYPFQSFRDFLVAPRKKAAILRHDVDARKEHSLQFARIQWERGIAGTYYFRVVPQSFDPGVIREIHAMGHEIGYHYEDMDFAKGNPKVAIKLFEKHLAQIRDVAPVSTICMHGSPRSKFDNKDLWKYYDFRAYDIIGEPYFDLDFKKVFYLTDTGRRWDGRKVSVRDKTPDHFGLSFRSTGEIISSLRRGRFPERVMFNFHPQRWTDDKLLWWREKISQELKNTVKFWLIKARGSHREMRPPSPGIFR